MQLKIILLMSLLIGCSHSAQSEKLEKRAQKICHHLADLLSSVDTKEDFISIGPEFRELCIELSRLALQVSNQTNEGARDTTGADRLHIELRRLYKIPGMRALIESYEQEGIAVLIKGEPSLY